MQYRKKPVVIEAEQVQAGMIGDLISSAIAEGKARSTEHDEILIETLEGSMIARPGDWIIKGINGEFYPCKPDIFAAIYDPIPDPSKTAIGQFSYLKCLGRAGKGEFIACGQAEFDEYTRSLRPEQRFMDKTLASAGFENMMVGALPCVVVTEASMAPELREIEDLLP